MDIDKYYDKVEAYIGNSLSSEDKKSFEEQMNTDKNLKRAVLNHVLANETLGLTIEDRIAGKLKKLEKQQDSPSEKARLQIDWKRRLAVAAGILLLIIAGTFVWAGQNYTEQALADTFYAESTLPTVRNDNLTNEQFYQGLASFKKAAYESAIDNFSSIPKTDIFYYNAQYMLAHAYWKKGDYVTANNHFETLLSENSVPQFIDRQEVEWNSLLLTMRIHGAKDNLFKEKFTLILANPQHGYYQQAAALSKKLNSFWRHFSL